MDDKLQAAIPGPETRKILGELVPDAIDGLESGEVAWDLLPAGGIGVSATEAVARAQAVRMAALEEQYLVLYHVPSGGERHEGRISAAQADRLLAAWDYERRLQAPSKDRPSTFPLAGLEAWVGIKPGADWNDLVWAYRLAAKELEPSLSGDRITAPYLFLCRHALELHLKSIVSAGQIAMNLVEDLPAHHDLLRLWSAAYPIVAYYSKGDEASYPLHHRAEAVVKHLHDCDPGSFNFRYPVTKKNKPISHKEFLLAFDLGEFASRFREVMESLDTTLRAARIHHMFSSIARAPTNAAS